MNRKLALLAATAIVSGLLSVPAFADVNVVANINKDKDVFVDVSVSITKDIEIDVSLVDATAKGLAEAEAFVNADTSNNTVNLELEGSNDGVFTKRLATMGGKDQLDVDEEDNPLKAVSDNTGVILQFNQDVGDNVNQGNVVSIALVDIEDDDGTDNLEYAVAHSEAAVSQRSANNNVKFDGSLSSDSINPRNQQSGNFQIRAEIENVMERNLGVVMGNQNAGQNSNQHNAMALALGVDTALALSEGDLGQEVSFNDKVIDQTSFKRAQIADSINNNQGVTAFNQNTGHNNNQSTVISLAATGAASNLLPDPGP